MAKTQNVEKWGRATAKERYDGHASIPKADAKCQVNQDPVDKHDPNYDNDTSGWVHGAGEDATKKPSFDKHKSGT